MLQTMLRPRHGKQRTARWREMCEVHGRWFLYYSGVSCGSWTYPALSTGIIDLKFITNRFIFVLQAFYFPADSKIVFAKQQWKFELLSGFIVMQDAVHAKYSFNLALHTMCIFASQGNRMRVALKGADQSGFHIIPYTLFPWVENNIRSGWRTSNVGKNRRLRSTQVWLSARDLVRHGENPFWSVLEHSGFLKTYLSRKVQTRW